MRLPSLTADMVPAATEAGRVTKGAAQALLGKGYLYEKKWNEAAAQFADVNGTPGGTSKYGYHLLNNFSDIFRVDNKFNSESIIEITHTSIAASGWGNVSKMEGMIASQMVGQEVIMGRFTIQDGAVVLSPLPYLMRYMMIRVTRQQLQILIASKI